MYVVMKVGMVVDIDDILEEFGGQHHVKCRGHLVKKRDCHTPSIKMHHFLSVCPSVWT